MPEWTPEEARENAAKGGKARAEKLALEKAYRDSRDLSQEERARLFLAQKSEALAGELVAAAMGHGVFSNLSPKDRMQALIKALEWGIGRPRPTKATVSEPTEPDAPPEGIEVS